MYDIPPHVPLQVSRYEMELEITAKQHAALIAKVGDENLSMYDNDLSLDEIDAELDNLAGQEAVLPPTSDLEEVSMDDALDALKEELGS